MLAEQYSDLFKTAVKPCTLGRSNLKILTFLRVHLHDEDYILDSHSPVRSGKS